MSEDQQRRETTTKHQRKTLVRIISYKKRELSEGLIKPKEIKIQQFNIFKLNGIYMSYSGEQNNNRLVGPRHHSFSNKRHRKFWNGWLYVL